MCEEPGVEATVGKGKICCEEGVSMYCCMSRAGKYCCSGSANKSCSIGIVVYYIRGAPIIMCVVPSCLEEELATGSQITLLFGFFQHNDS
jgi:hypothetical protein